VRSSARSAAAAMTYEWKASGSSAEGAAGPALGYEGVPSGESHVEQMDETLRPKLTPRRDKAKHLQPPVLMPKRPI